jgi:outer membrane protein assembly factor BamB
MWWYDLTAPSFGSAAVADIDHDGKLEIVFGTYFNDERIHALNAEDGSVHWVYPTGGCNDASPAIADVDLDGDLEVIVPASSPQEVYCFDGVTGAVEWSIPVGHSIDSPPAIADVDYDGKPEIVFGTFLGHVFCLNGEDGSTRWHVNLGTNSFIQSGPSIADLDGDGWLDVVVAQWAGDSRVYALSGQDGSTKWYCDRTQDYMYHGGSFADIDEDGALEVAIGCYDRKVHVMNGEDGSFVWQYPASLYVGSPTSIADLNNDDHLEIVFAQHNILGVLSHTGSLLWSHPTGGSIFRGAAIADMDGDNGLDVVFGSADGVLRVLKGHNGEVISSYDLEAHYDRTFDMDHAPVIADLDGDGRLDIFVVGGYGSSSPSTGNHGRAYALSAGAVGGPGWSMFRHDLQHSGTYGSPPEVPALPVGPAEGIVGRSYEYLSDTIDLEGDDVYFVWNWGDGSISGWLGPYGSGETGIAAHEWSTEGTYRVRVKAKDTGGRESDWSDPWTIRVYTQAITVPDGSESGTSPLLVTKRESDLNITWDAETSNCASVGYHLIWGWGSDIEFCIVSGSDCTLDASGGHLWTTAPDTSSNWCWFLVVGNDGSTTEGGWGTDSELNQRSTGASGECGMVAIETTACVP